MVKWVDLSAVVLGFALLVSGVAMLNVPAALILAGTLVLVGVVWRVR